MDIIWVYEFNKDWPNEDQERAVEKILIRPTYKNEEGEPLVGKILEFTFYALEYFNNLENNPIKEHEELLDIYYNKLNNDNYYILDREIEDDDDYFIVRTDVYLKDISFTKKEVFEWVDKLFILKGLEKPELTEADAEHFMDLNPIMQLFSLKNVKKFEGQFGKDWWKKDK